MPHRRAAVLPPDSPPPPAPPPTPLKRSTSRSGSTSDGHHLGSIRRRSIDWYSFRLTSALPTPPASPEEPVRRGSSSVGPSLESTAASHPRHPASPLSPPPSVKPFRMPSLGNMALSRFGRRSTASSERINAGAREATREFTPLASPASPAQGSSSSSGLSRLEQFNTPSLMSMRGLDREAERRASALALVRTTTTPDGKERRSPQTLDSPTCRSFQDRYPDLSRPPSNDEPPRRLVQHSSQPEVSSSSTRTSPRMPRIGRRPKTAENKSPSKFGISEVLSPASKRSPRPRTHTLTSASPSPRLVEGSSDLWPESTIGLSASAASSSHSFLPNVDDSPPGGGTRSRSSLHKDRSASGQSLRDQQRCSLSPRISISGLASAGTGLGIDFEGGPAGRDDESYTTVRSPVDGQPLRRGGSNERLCSIECFGESYSKHVSSLAVPSGLPQVGLSPPPRPRRKSKAPGHRRTDSATSSSRSSSWSSYSRNEETSRGQGPRRGSSHHRVRLSIAENEKWEDHGVSSHSRSSSTSSVAASPVSSRAVGDHSSPTAARRISRKNTPTPLRLSTLSEDDLSMHVPVGPSSLEPAPQPTPSPTIASRELLERRPKPSLLLPVSPPLSPTVSTDVAIAHANMGLRERIDQLKSQRQRERDLRDAASSGAIVSSDAELNGSTPRSHHSALNLLHPTTASPAGSVAVSLPSVEGDDLEDYWSMESHSFTGPPSMSLSTSPSSIPEHPRRMSPPPQAVLPLSQPRAPVPPRGLLEAGLSEEEALKARLRWANDQITEACRIIAMAAMRFVSDDGVPPYLETARGARPFSILRDTRLVNLEAGRRHRLLNDLLLHLVLSTLHRELCEPFCYGYSHDDTAHATRLLNMVWSQTPIEAATVQRTLHLSMRQSLPPHLRSAYRSNVRAKLHGSIGLLFAWCGLVARPSDSNLHIAKGHAALKASIEELAHIVDDAREAGGVEAERNSPDSHTSMLPATAASRSSSLPPAAIINARETTPTTGRASEYGAFEICLPEERSSKGLVAARALGITQRTSTAAHRVILQPRSSVILDA